MDLVVRPVTSADIPVIAALQERWDTRWFGAPEEDESEVRSSLDRVSPLEQCSVLLHDGDRLVARAGGGRPTTPRCSSTPTSNDPGVHDALVGWLVASGASHAEALAGDELLRAALAKHGWAHGSRSSS